MVRLFSSKATFMKFHSDFSPNQSVSKNENDLIEVFLTRMEAIQPDILVGYNSDYFDIPYIFHNNYLIMV